MCDDIIDESSEVFTETEHGWCLLSGIVSVMTMLTCTTGQHWSPAAHHCHACYLDINRLHTATNIWPFIASWNSKFEG